MNKRNMTILLFCISMFSSQSNCKDPNMNDIKVEELSEERKTERQKEFKVFLEKLIIIMAKEQKISAAKEYIDKNFTYDNFYNNNELIKLEGEMDKIYKVDDSINFKNFMHVLKHGKREVDESDVHIYMAKQENPDLYPYITFAYNEKNNKWEMTSVYFVFE